LSAMSRSAPSLISSIPWLWKVRTTILMIMALPGRMAEHH
jgi:hypothetical protein